MLFYIKIKALSVLLDVLDSVQSSALMASYRVDNLLSDIVQTKLRAEGRL